MKDLYRCSKCKQHKPIEEMARNKNKADGVDGWCRNCHREASRRYAAANPEKVYESARFYRDRHPEKVKKWASTRNNRRVNLKARFDMTPEQYDELLASQGGVCAICGEYRVESHRNNMHIDHDEETGKVRGILCGRCNMAIGLLLHLSDRVERAAEYLRTASTPYGLRRDLKDRRCGQTRDHQ